MSFVSVSEDEEDRRNDILHCAEKGDSLPGGRVVKTFEGELNHRQNAIKKQYEGVNKDAPAKMGDFAKLDMRVEKQIYAPLARSIESVKQTKDGVVSEVKTLHGKVGVFGKQLTKGINAAKKANSKLAADVDKRLTEMAGRINEAQAKIDAQSEKEQQQRVIIKQMKFALVAAVVALLAFVGASG